MNEYLFQLTGWHPSGGRADLLYEEQKRQPELYRALKRFFMDRENSFKDAFAGFELKLGANTRERDVGDCCRLHSGGFLVSSRFKRFLERGDWLIEPIEFFPVSLEFARRFDFSGFGGSGKVSNDYWLMNAYGKLDLIDEPASDILWGSQGRPADEDCNISEWKRLALTAAPDRDLFGIQRLPRRRFLSERLAREIKAQGLSVGIRTIPLFASMPYISDVTRSMNHSMEFLG